MLIHMVIAVVSAAILGLRLARAYRGANAAAVQYRLLADNASDMIFIVDRQYNRSFVSPACRDLLGYEPGELAGLPASHVIHPDDAAQVIAIFAEMFAGRDRAASTHRLRHRDTHLLNVDAVFKLVRDPDTGEPLEICGALRDVSQRVAAETALRASDERFQLLVQQGVPDALYMLGPTGDVESWNAGAERIKGYSPTEIIGRNFATFFTQEDVARGEPLRLLAIAGDTGRFTGEGWRVRKDGRHFLAHVTFDAIHRHDGTLRGFAKLTRDVTNIRIEEEQRAIIIEAAPNGMMIVDEPGTITLANSEAERVFGYERASLVGKPVEILVPEESRAAHSALPAAFTSGLSEQGMPPQRQFAGRKFDGSIVMIEIMLSPVENPHGRIVVASLFDVTERIRQITEQREAEERERLAAAATNTSLDRLSQHLAKARDRAEQANRAKSRFLAGMSHELRTPLNGIFGYAHLLHIEGGLNPAQIARVDAMLRAGKHLIEMITCVLDLSEIETEHVQLQAVEFDLQAVGAACLDLVRPMAEAKGLTLGITVAPGTRPELIADPTRLRQIMLNLLGNAVKFTAQGGAELRLRGLADDSALRIEVADTGPGISAEQRHRLFRDFDRLDIEATDKVEGAWLGLALSARLANLIGGRLGHDGNPSGGSVFWLELPRLGTVAASPAVAMPSGFDMPDGGTILPSDRILHVLVVVRSPVISPDPLVFDATIFERTIAFLSPEVVASYLKTITDGCGTLLDGLRKPGAPGLGGDELAEAAHRLAGSAGMFGFERVATLGRRFEQAVQTGSAEAPALADGLGAALEDTLQAIHDRMSK